MIMDFSKTSAGSMLSVALMTNRSHFDLSHTHTYTCQNEHYTAVCVTLGWRMCECAVALRARGTSPSTPAHCWISFTAAREAESGVSRVRHSPVLEVDFSDLIRIDCWYDFTTHYWPAAHLLLLSIIWLRALLAGETERCCFPLCL